MTPDQIENMRRDMEAGTPGPWEANIDGTGDWFVSGGNHQPVCEVGADGEGPAEEDARRIARVPQLEAEVLRLREALRSIDNMDPRLGNNGNRNDLIAVAAVQIANHALKGSDQ